MITKKQIEKAVRYNVRNVSNEPNVYPWNEYTKFEGRFAVAVALFQSLNGLTVDGMLGPDTQYFLRRFEVDENQKYSNCVVINGESVFVDVTAGGAFKVTNFKDDDEVRFHHTAKDFSNKQIVSHETAGYHTTKQSTIKHLLRKKYGYHIIIDHDGSVSNHGDLERDKLSHAGFANSFSVAVVLVNPYISEYQPDDSPWKQEVESAWWHWRNGKKSNKYVVPTPAQLKTFNLFIPWLAEKLNIKLDFPAEVLNVNRQVFTMQETRRLRGIVPHGAISKNRADGWFACEYLKNKGE
jgi:hypothetical protein